MTSAPSSRAPPRWRWSSRRRDYPTNSREPSRDDTRRAVARRLLTRNGPTSARPAREAARAWCGRRAARASPRCRRWRRRGPRDCTRHGSGPVPGSSGGRCGAGSPRRCALSPDRARGSCRRASSALTRSTTRPRRRSDGRHAQRKDTLDDRQVRRARRRPPGTTRAARPGRRGRSTGRSSAPPRPLAPSPPKSRSRRKSSTCSIVVDTPSAAHAADERRRELRLAAAVEPVDGDDSTARRRGRRHTGGRMRQSGVNSWISAAPAREIATMSSSSSTTGS